MIATPRAFYWRIKVDVPKTDIVAEAFTLRRVIPSRWIRFHIIDLETSLPPAARCY
jgi:hypothetical protein